MSDDLISREALKNTLNEILDTVEFMLFDDIIAIIDNAPTVLHDNYSMGYQDGVRKVLSERPQGERWIPVSERLPDKSGRYLITIREGIWTYKKKKNRYF